MIYKGFTFDLQGHRGCRGLMPENSIPAFEKALKLGVDTLEMDLVISKDKKVIVSHEPFLSHEFCLDLEGNVISEADEKSFNLFNMDYDLIKRFDCGSKTHPRFLKQEKMTVSKPLFSEVVSLAENFYKSHNNPPILYNVEIKSTIEGDHIFHPTPGEFAELVIKELQENKIIERTIVQSFDIRALKYIKENYPNVILSLLIENKLTPEENIELLGFIPDIYSPEFILVNENLIQFARKEKMKVLPWTVNEIREIEVLLKFGVDGIITDYPSLI